MWHLTSQYLLRIWLRSIYGTAVLTDASTPLRNNCSNALPLTDMLSPTNDVKPTSPKVRQITLHEIPMSTPMRDIIANRAPKELNPHFQSETKWDNSTIVTLKSEGEFEVRVTKKQFEDLIEVTADTVDCRRRPMCKVSWMEVPGIKIYQNKYDGPAAHEGHKIS